MKSNRQRKIKNAKCKISVFLILVFFLANLPVFGALNSTYEERLAVFDDLWTTIRERYYDPKLRGIDWLQQRAIFRQRAANAATQKEFYAILRQMVGELNDSHTRIYSPEEKFDWNKPRVVSIGLTVREIENQLIVTAVQDDSLAAQAGIKPGDLITKIDNIPAEVVFAQKLKIQNGSSTLGAARLRAVATLFEGEVSSLVNVNWRNEKGKENSVSLKREWREIKGNFKVKQAGKIAIISFDIFSTETTREFSRVAQTNLRQAKGIVIDLRSNRGGTAESMTDVASAFLPQNTKFGNFTDRRGQVAIESVTSSTAFSVIGSIVALKQPVVILTGTATASAAEIFTAALKENKRAVIVGGNTCGCVLAVKRRHPLPDGGVLEISELDYRTEKGVRLEGKGIAPDEPVQPTIADIRQNRDRILETSLQVLKNN
jgi:carboxyl-terminal processing protease